MKPGKPSLGEWNAYVEGGASRDDRAARLAEAPEALQGRIRNHVESVFRLRQQARVTKQRRAYVAPSA